VVNRSCDRSTPCLRSLGVAGSQLSQPRQSLGKPFEGKRNQLPESDAVTCRFDVFLDSPIVRDTALHCRHLQALDLSVSMFTLR